MDKFRVISDLHIDLNGDNSPSINDDVFTVVCGDTSGYPDKTIEWINTNIKAGVGVSGNHLPYSTYERPIQEYRDQLATKFSIDNAFTYLDAECQTYSKLVDGVLFVGSCFYSDMKMPSDFNPNGNVALNKMHSHRRMNDYKYGIRDCSDGKIAYITPDDYIKWNENALKKFEVVIDENEKKENPFPVVVVTHYPMVKEVVDNSYYVDANNKMSYGNDMANWFESYPSIKCHCCGHCHDMPKEWRSFKKHRSCGDLLVVNNSFGYWHSYHDITFNVNRFVNVNTWEVEELPEPEEVRTQKEERLSRLRTMAMWFR